MLSKSNPTKITRLSAITGCILGTALGDAVGLKREGLSRDRAVWLHGKNPSPDLIFGRGYCSDDTEHTVMLACAILKSGGNVRDFEKYFGGYLRTWLATCPAGIGLGTLRAILKSCVTMGARSGVRSAGNGPAMRAGLIGLLAADEEHLVQLSISSTRVTHRDPRAEEGAFVVARAAQFAYKSPDRDPIEFVSEMIEAVDGEELRNHLIATKWSLESRVSPREFAEERGWGKGPTGYINQTVPSAVYCWAYSPNDFRAVVTNAVLLGGDTDSVGAVAGAIAGAGCGTNALPEDWLSQLAEWPRDIEWMKSLACDLELQLSKRESSQSLEKVVTFEPARPPSMRWGRTYLRNFVFAMTVIVLYFRRYIPIRSRTGC